MGADWFGYEHPLPEIIGEGIYILPYLNNLPHKNTALNL